MRSILTSLLVLPLALSACVVGTEEDGTGGTGDGTGGGGGGGGAGGGGGGGGGSGSGTSISGSIASDTSWTGNVKITGATTIEAGVTVSVAAGTTIDVAPGAAVTILGILDAEGTKAAPVNIQPEGGTGTFGMFNIQSGGRLEYTYVNQFGGGILTSTGATAVIVDTYMSRVSGDFIVMNGGSIDVQWSQLGMEAGQTDTTHCNLHINGASTIKVTNSNISTTPYGLMFYGGTAADFTNNNWFGNTKDVDSQSGVSGDFSGSWFEDGAPTPVGGATLTVNNLSATRLTAGPR